VARNLFLLLVICIGLKGKYNVVIPVTERKAAIMENIQNQGNHRRSDICKRCGRKLKTPESVEIGFGAICFKKFMAESLLKPLFEVKRNEPSRETKAEEARQDSPKRASNKRKSE
jgi:ATP-dependent helicase YprA (DUF1998 family)